MALRFDASADALTRSANYPAVTSFTVCGVSVINSDRGAGVGQPYVTVKPDALASLLWDIESGAMQVVSYNGSDYNTTAFTNRPAVGVRAFWYLRCSGSGANLLQAGWMPFGNTSFTEQRSTTLTSGSATSLVLNDNWANQDMNAVKVWNHALSDAELLAEAASERAVKTTGLLIDSPMTGANVTAAAADLSGNGYNWTVGGTLAVVTGPSYGYSLTAAYGSFGLTGQAAALKRGLKVTAAQGSFTLSGQAAGLAKGRTLTAAQASFALAGQAASLKAARLVGAGQGAFALTGQAAGLLKGRTLPAAYAQFTLTGEAAGLSAGRRLTSARGAFTLSGQAAALIKSRALAANYGSLSLSGQAVAFGRTYRLVAAYGDFALTGQAALLAQAAAGIYARPLDPLVVSAPALDAPASLTASPLSGVTITAPPL